MLRHRKATQMSDWEPDLYNRFRRYRAEPVAHILSRLQLGDGEEIIDLGCGSGENTFELARRSARGSALGVDGSPAMIEAARKLLEAEPAELKRRLVRVAQPCRVSRRPRLHSDFLERRVSMDSRPSRAVRRVLRGATAGRNDRRADAGQRDRNAEGGSR